MGVQDSSIDGVCAQPGEEALPMKRNSSSPSRAVPELETLQTYKLSGFQTARKPGYRGAPEVESFDGSGLHEIFRCEVCGTVALQSSLNLGLHPMCDDLVPIGDGRVCKEYPIEILFCGTCQTAHQRFQ